jgi:hypothetical protein
MLNAAQATKQLLNTVKIAFAESQPMSEANIQRMLADLKIKFAKNDKPITETHKKIYLDISESFYVCNFCLEEIPFSIDPRKIYKHQAYECVAMPDDKLGFMQAKHIKIKQFRPRELAMLAHMIKNNLTETTNLMFHPFDASFDKDNNLIIKLH